ISPHFHSLSRTPVSMMREGASSAYVTAASVAILVYGAYCVSTWNRLKQARAAEAAARIDAEQKRVAAERLMASRAAFLAAVGHDLRTPIGAILTGADRKSTRLNSSHVKISYAVFCLKTKKLTILILMKPKYSDMAISNE